MLNLYSTGLLPNKCLWNCEWRWKQVCVSKLDSKFVKWSIFIGTCAVFWGELWDVQFIWPPHAAAHRMVYHVEPGSWQPVPDTIQQNYKESGASGAPTAVDKEKWKWIVCIYAHIYIYIYLYITKPFLDHGWCGGHQVVGLDGWVCFYRWFLHLKDRALFQITQSRVAVSETYNNIEKIKKKTKTQTKKNNLTAFKNTYFSPSYQQREGPTLASPRAAVPSPLPLELLPGDTEAR